MVCGLPWHGNNASSSPPTPGASKKVDTYGLSFVDLLCGFRGWTTMPCASGMRTGRSPLWRICYGRSSWIMVARLGSALVECKSFIRLGRTRRFASSTILGCSILFLALEFVFRFTGTLPVLGRVVSFNLFFGFLCTSPGQLVSSFEYCLFHKLE
jgi:hypothetical protein